VARERRPRLEFLPAAAPAAEDALRRAGFVNEARLPIMTCAPAQLREVARPGEVELDAVAGGDALREAAAVQNAAYGAPPATDADVARLEDTVAAGGIVGLAREGERSRRRVGPGRRSERRACGARRRRGPAAVAAPRDRRRADRRSRPGGV
jgi:hypothetical protein